jgi:predicted protein tyrosine phosphatase
MYYADGSSPPPEIIAQWITLVGDTFDKVKNKDEIPCIAIHCVAGLGRYAVLRIIII